MRLLALLFLLTACAGGGQAPPTPLDARVAAIVQHAHAAGPGQALLVGDSITALQTLTTACGLAVVNGGISGATTASYLSVIDRILAAARPTVVTVMIGGGDLRPPVHLAATKANYAAILDRIGHAGAQAVLITYPPVEQSAGGQFDPAAALGFGSFVPAIGAARGLPVIDAHAGLAGPDGWMPPGGTLDGFHTRPELLEPFVRQAIGAGLPAGCPV